MELGISSFGEMKPDHSSGKAANAHRRVAELMAEVQLADKLGLDVFAFGEHHREDFVISAPEVLLGAAAAVTKNIRLSSSVTVLSSADPVRTYQNFATVDLLSSGRAEIMAGRGSFIESFPLFGYDLKYYNELFSEKLDLLLKINASEKVSWKGEHRAAIDDLGVYPRAYQQAIPVWIAVGGTPESAVRAGRLNLPMTLAILGGDPKQYVPFINLYRQSAKEAGHDVSKLQVGINSQFYIADDSEQAADEFWPSYEKLMNRVGKERGWSPITRDQFEYMRSPEGPLFVGNVQEVIDKVLLQHTLFQNTRFLAQSVTGDIAHDKILHAIDLFATKVAPVVRKELGK
jgi:probable LLM family oxidoreductase